MPTDDAAAVPPDDEVRPGGDADGAPVPGSLDADARALASVVRMRILRLCLDEALTNKEVAARLGRSPASTFHHVRLLAERGFLAAQEERRGARGAREVPYLSTRKSWNAPEIPGSYRVLVDAFLEELAEADPSTVWGARLGLRLGQDGWDLAKRRLTEVLQELAELPPEPGGTPYSLFLMGHEDAARLPRPDEPS
ncbi:winged helix-turn-helix domain-containing protein [Actinotalea sp. AC32]|nr:winged helix-turn-helix domain-containing protein [Actinotalea sp. AC32]